ncbi:hypothetical protein VTJ83DRAFT_1492 [Remersonia thermophila]|uniref:EGF-like domain-containing protein n=1 Tax=Remersonia thermophila TaxID=72144 RepID=A0ABR4DG11_9PEZI
MLRNTLLVALLVMGATAIPTQRNCKGRNCVSVIVCGNGVVEGTEECDLGYGLNGAAGSGCSADCKIVPVDECVCGDGKVGGDEECDDGDKNGTPESRCDANCKLKPVDPPVCQTCDPNPFHNKCDITTSCITTMPNGRHYCACRAGYRANDIAPTDSRQFRLPFIGQEYRVFVAPGVVCNQLCDNPFPGPDSCREVPVQSC